MGEVARAFRGSPDTPAASGTRAPRIKRGWRYTELQFGGGVSQSRMRTFRPGHLLIDYTRTMMAALLFRPQPALIGMIGLGGGSQAKFCHSHLPATRLEVAENNPQVLALRRSFRVPPDDARLQVLLADGAQYVRERRGCYISCWSTATTKPVFPRAFEPALLTTMPRCAGARRCACRQLYATDFRDHVRKLQRSFGRERVRVLEEARQSNRVVFAWKGDPFPGGRIDLPAIVARMPPAASRELADVFARVARAWQSG